MTFTKEKAITELNNLIGKIQFIAERGRNSSEHIQWLFNCNSILLKLFGKNSSLYVSFVSLQWHETGQIIMQTWNIQAALEERHNRAFHSDLEVARGIFYAAIDEINSVDDIIDVYKDKIEVESNAAIKLLNAVSKFRRYIHEQPKNEKEIQDNFERLLIGTDFKYSREKERFEYSSKSYIPDFVLNDLNMAIEIKFCNSSGKERELVDEINADILAYNTKYKNSMFIIYDIGQIRNEEQFKSPFTAHENIFVVIVKH